MSKKITLTAISAAFVAMSAIANAPQQFTDLKVSPNKLNAETVTPNGLRVPKKNVPAKEIEKTPVITNPEGEAFFYKTVATGTYAFYGYLFTYENQVSASEMVFGDNNEVYFKDIIPNTGAETYVKGIREDNVITVDFPQTIMDFEDYGYAINLAVVTYDAEEDWYFYNPDVASVKFTIDEKGAYALIDLPENSRLGLVYTDDDSWNGYSVSSLTGEVFTDTPVELPATADVQNDWVYSNGMYGYKVSFATDGDKAYIGNLCEAMPGAWFEGTLDNDKVTIKNNQYMGLYSSNFVYLMAFRFTGVDENGNSTYDIMPADYEYVLKYDAEKGELTSVDNSVTLVFNASTERLYYVQILDNLNLKAKSDFSGTPQNPNNLSWVNYMDDYGYDAFYFNVPGLSTDGEVLLTENLSYLIYVDEEVWEFDAEEYQIAESLIEVPWNFGAYYIYKSGPITREVDFFAEGISTVGVQSIYRYNGEETSSDIVTLDLEATDGVNAVDADKTVAKVVYFDLAGRAINKPANGLYIQRTTYTDGTSVSAKKFVR